MKNGKYAASVPVFRLQNVSYSYGGQFALSGITLTVRKGERVALLGANGSGKSTLLKLLDALIFPESGTFEAFGRPINADSPADGEDQYGFRRRVGYVFQDPEVQLFSATVWDEVLFAPLQMGLPVDTARRQATEAMEVVGIAGLKDRPTHHLSLGEKKKTALASVLSYRPDVWLFDEPTSGLDPRSSGMFLDFMADIRKKGATVVTATHDLETLSDLADRVIVLSEDHKIASEGVPGNILADRRLLVRHNLIHSHLHSHGTRIHSHAHTHPRRQ